MEDAKKKMHKIVFPHIRNKVAAKVLKTTAKQVELTVFEIEGCRSVAYRAIIRLQNFRDCNTDTLVIRENFKPGDIVLAKIISYDKHESLYLSTIEDEFGVVVGLADTNDVLVVPGENVLGSADGRVCEKRKIAKNACEEVRKRMEILMRKSDLFIMRQTSHGKRNSAKNL